MGHGSAGMGAGHSLMIPEERTVQQEKMHNAKTPHRGPRAGATSEADAHRH